MIYRNVNENRQKLQGNNTLIIRGIHKIASANGWSANADGWIYPVYALSGQAILTHRWKAFDSQQTPKYRWKPNKPAGCDYYVLPGIRQAIAAAGGVLWIANGEPSVLTYHAAGIRNVLSWFGETSVPVSLAGDLRELGVREVRYPVDRDQSGVKSALKVRGLLQDSGIDFVPLQWPALVPEKGDANDLWMAVNFEPHVFRGILSSLLALELPEPDTGLHAPFRPNQPVDDTLDYTAAQERVVRDILLALGVSDFHRNGWSRKPILNPCYPDTKPSAYVHQDSGVVHDFGAGRSYSPQEVAVALGIPWPKRAYTPDTARPPARFTPEQIRAALGHLLDQGKPATLALWEAVPDSWRGAVMGFIGKGGKSGPFLEALHHVFYYEFLPEEGFTTGELCDALNRAGYAFAERTVYRTLKQLEGVLVETLPAPKQSEQKGRAPVRWALMTLDRAKEALLARAWPQIYQQYHPVDDENPLPVFERKMLDALGLEDIDPDELNVRLKSALQQQRERYAEAGHHSSRHHRAHREFAVLSRWLDDQYSSDLDPAFDLTDVLDYRAAILRAHVEANPAQPRSNAYKCRLLGCSKGSLKKIETRAGVKNVPESRDVAIKKPGNVGQMISTANGFPVKITALTGDGQRISQPYRRSSAELFAAAHIEEGNTVSVTLQLTSTQTIVSEAPVPFPEPVTPPEPQQVVSPSPQRETREPSAIPPRAVQPWRTILPPIKHQSDQFVRLFAPLWVCAKLVAALEAATPYRVRDGCIVDLQGRVILQAVTPSDVAKLVLYYDDDLLMSGLLDLGGRFT